MKTIFEKSQAGKRALSIAACDVPEYHLEAEILRQEDARLLSLIHI